MLGLGTLAARRVRGRDRLEPPDAPHRPAQLAHDPLVRLRHLAARLRALARHGQRLASRSGCGRSRRRMLADDRAARSAGEFSASCCAARTRCRARRAGRRRARRSAPPRRRGSRPRGAEDRAAARAQCARTGGSSRSPLTPMPPPSTTSATSATAAIGEMCSAIRRASSATTSLRDRIARARGVEDRAHVVRAPRARSRRRAPRAARRAPRPRSRTDRSATPSPEPDAKSTSPAAPWWPRWSSPPSTSPLPSPVPTERNAKSSTPAPTPRHCSPSAARLMSFSTDDRAAEPGRELVGDDHALEPRDVLGELHDARRRARPRPGTPTTMPSRRSAGTPLASISRPASPSTVSSTTLTSAPPCSTSSRARTTPSRSQTACAGSGRRCRCRARAPPRRPARRRARRSSGPPGRRGRLAHQPRLEQRLQRERDRRLRDPDAPGDLGARDRPLAGSSRARFAR